MLKDLFNGLTGSGLHRRAVLVHAHMFKNAGSTFDWSLQRSFGDSFLDHRDDDAMKKGASYLGSLLEREQGLKAISSHWIGFPLPELDSVDIHLAMFFRDPIERIRSVYNFERKQEPASTPGAKKAKQLGFLDYVKWRLKLAPGPAIKNFHTRYCSGNYFGESLEQMFESSQRTIESTPLLGLVDRYDESMVLFEYFLDGTFPELDLAWRRQNISSEQVSTCAERRQAVEDDLKPILDEVLASNQYDLQLYKLVEEKFDRALAGVPSLDSRLLEMQSRNSALQ